MNNENIVWHQHVVNQQTRSELKKQKPCLLWFTGLSGSGKSTIAGRVETLLAELSCHTYLLDGDNIRHRLCADLGFSDSDRVENIRRIGEVSHLMVDAGLIVLSAFISPFTANRKMVRDMLKHGEFIEVFIDTPLGECEKRDPKGLYKKARAGEIKDFTGIDSPYEAPINPELRIVNHNIDIDTAAMQVVDYLRQHGYILGAVDLS
ncbi:MAG: adenylyl-sulfate kinase [Shewanella sp.]|nr:adenylyl-sulfate kinase [Shewanella sp.]